MATTLASWSLPSLLVTSGTLAVVIPGEEGVRVTPGSSESIQWRTWRQSITRWLVIQPMGEDISHRKITQALCFNWGRIHCINCSLVLKTGRVTGLPFKIHWIYSLKSIQPWPPKPSWGKIVLSDHLVAIPSGNPLIATNFGFSDLGPCDGG